MKLGIKPFYTLAEVGQLAGGVAAETVRFWIWQDQKHVLEDGWAPDDHRIKFPHARDPHGPRGRVPLKDVLAYTGMTPDLLAMVELDEPATAAS